MKALELKEQFENYKLLHNFLYDDPLKKWINKTNFNNLFIKDWNELMKVVEKIDTIGASVIIGKFFCEIKYKNLDNIKNFDVRMASKIKITAVYSAVIQFIKWYNYNLK